MIPIAAMALTMISATKPDDPVIVDRVPLTPQANLLFADGSVSVHPYLGLGAGWGNDPRGIEDGTSAWGTALAGSAVRWHPTAVDRVTADASARVRGSDSSNTGTYWNGQGRLEGNHEGRAGWINGGTRYSRENEFVPTLGGTVRTDSLDGHLSAAQIAPFSGLVVKLAGAEQWFDGIGSDRDRILGNAEVNGFLSTGDARWGVTLRGDAVNYRDQTRYSSSLGAAALASAQIGIGNQSSLVAELGAMMRNYDQGAGDHQVIAPAWSLAVVLNQPDGSSISLTASSVLEDNLAGNAEVFSSLTAEVRVALAPPWQLALQGRAGIGRDTGKPTGNEVERRSQIDGRVGLEYHLPGEGSVVRLEVSGEDYKAKFAGDWHGARVELSYLAVW